MTSTADPAVLGPWLRRTYGLGSPFKLSFWLAGINLTYFAETPQGRRVLRVYTPGWRTRRQVEFELELLLHLKRSGIPVAHPLPARDGSLVQDLELPNGRTFAALFSYAEKSGGRPWAEAAHDSGTLLARLHLAQAAFRPKPPSPEMNLKGLVDVPLRWLRPYSRAFWKDDGWDRLKAMAAKVKRSLARLPTKAPYYGLIHGDMHAGNMAYHQALKTDTLFDFDSMARGWRLYDLATLLWSLRENEKMMGRMLKPVVLSYSSLSPLSPLEVRLIPDMMAARQIFYMGFPAGYAERFGTSTVSPERHWQKMRFMHHWYGGGLRKALAPAIADTLARLKPRSAPS